MGDEEEHEARVERARRLRDRIDKIIRRARDRPAAADPETPDEPAQGESPREFVERRTRELDAERDEEEPEKS